MEFGRDSDIHFDLVSPLFETINKIKPFRKNSSSTIIKYNNQYPSTDSAIGGSVVVTGVSLHTGITGPVSTGSHTLNYESVKAKTVSVLKADGTQWRSLEINFKKGHEHVSKILSEELTENGSCILDVAGWDDVKVNGSFRSAILILLFALRCGIS